MLKSFSGLLVFVLALSQLNSILAFEKFSNEQSDDGSFEIQRNEKQTQLDHNLASYEKTLQNEISYLKGINLISLNYLSSYVKMNLKIFHFVGKNQIDPFSSNPDGLIVNAQKRASASSVKFNIESEVEFCTECFLKISKDQACSYCYNKYLYKAAKRNKPASSKYWHSRAGRR